MSTPAGFHPHASGLVVPEHVARQREVWTKDERTLLTRAFKLLGSHKVKIALACEVCKQPLELLKSPESGDLLLRCDHLERVVTRAF